MNIVYQIERLRLGYGVQTQEDLAYPKLKCQSKDVYFIFDDEDTYCPLFTARFCTIPNRHNLLALANEDGKLVIHDVNKPTSDLVNIPAVQAHNNAIFDFAWNNFEMKILTASGDHTCILWDVGQSSINPLLCFQGHTRSVKTIAKPPDDRCIFATGGRDGLVMCWDTRINHKDPNLRPDVIIKFPHIKPTTTLDKFDTSARKKTKKTVKSSNPSHDSVTGLVFQDDYTLISCSAGDGLIKVWDMRKTYTQYKRLPQAKSEMQHPGDSARIGFTNLAISPCQLKLYASCVDNSIYCYNVGTYNSKPSITYRGHTVGSYYIKNTVSPCGRYIASGSSDDKAYIWTVSEPKRPLVTLQGHAAEVTCIDWCTQGELKLATCSDDASYRIWRVNSEELSQEESAYSFKGCAVTPVNDVEKVRPRGVKRMFFQTSHFRDDEVGGDGENNDPNTPDREQGTWKKRKRIYYTAHSSSTSQSEESHDLLMDLPNYVIDGTCSHPHCSQRMKHRGEPEVDWLTRLRQTSSPTSPSSAPIGLRRRRSSSSTRSGSCCPRGNLLNYFRISSRQQQQQQHCNGISNESTESGSQSPVT